MPWDPVRDLLTMHERLESLFGRANPGWVPPVDLVEAPDRYIVTVELPGVSRDGLRIETHESTLTVKGQRPAESCCPERYHQLERGQGQFARSFRFAMPVQTDAISAEFVDGVLTLVIPKQAPNEARDIPVE